MEPLMQIKKSVPLLSHQNLNIWFVGRRIQNKDHDLGISEQSCVPKNNENDKMSCSSVFSCFDTLDSKTYHYIYNSIQWRLFSNTMLSDLQWIDVFFLYGASQRFIERDCGQVLYQWVFFHTTIWSSLCIQT